MCGETPNIHTYMLPNFRLVANSYLLNVLKTSKNVMESMIVKTVQMRKIASILAKKQINFNVFMKIINHCLWNVFQKINIVTERKIVLMVRMKKIVQNQKT